jgi:cell division protein FtsZ
VVDNTVAPVIRKAPTTAAEYAELDKPTVTRNADAKVASAQTESAKGKDMDYLDIPAFLRRQAD